MSFLITYQKDIWTRFNKYFKETKTNAKNIVIV